VDVTQYSCGQLLFLSVCIQSWSSLGEPTSVLHKPLTKGLLSLTVEFYRSRTSDCSYDDFGNPISSNSANFPYGQNVTCGLICSTELGPFSPMRRGSADNIYIIPAPEKLTFGTATVLAAACCIPTVLSLVAMGSRILGISAESSFSKNDIDLNFEAIEGTNGATIGTLKAVNGILHDFMTVVEVPVFTAAVFTILVFGEMNFFSTQVFQYTEPIGSIGK
jgi:hypothetical protein